MQEKGSTDEEDTISVQHEICLVSNLWPSCHCANIAQSLYIIKSFLFCISSFLCFLESHHLTDIPEGILMRTRDFHVIPVFGVAGNAQTMGHSRSHWNLKEDPIPKSTHFQSPLNSNSALKPNALSLWYVTELMNLNHFRKGNPKGSSSPSLRRTNLTSLFIAW